MVNFMDGNKSVMSDYWLIDNHRELTKMLSGLDVDMKDFKHSLIYSKGEISEGVMENMIGKSQDLNSVSLTETISFRYGDRLMVVLRALCEDYCYIREADLPYTEQINKEGDVIHDYEYQEDGQNRLFTWSRRVTQNSNSDICVMNHTSDTTGDLVIMSPSGRMKFVYLGQKLTKNFKPSNVVCDSLCNILVIDYNNKQIHLLSPDGEFLKFLLTKNEVNHPIRLSLYKCTLWVEYWEGLIKVL
ncbi:uncharacterized protein LOC133187016 [Saccostrea echinata]|uniref:uncharacterized protein LOC133187016 n=1 Tax=Saccostrea echinata TaxID=191078 RepID=UPI002A82CD95|nr:uncharacterized protein LOC133187016 [Saccostrea echinata]